MKRTLLPLNALRVYDAAARHLSFTRAADELAVTPAAVGQQIRALEDQLGTVLFRREARGLELTGEGAAGLEPLREGFLKLEESVQAMQASQASNRFTLAVPRALIGEWLAPRLAEFAAMNPGVRFHFAEGDDADFTQVNLDAAIRLADGPGELEGVMLGEATRVTVAAPGAPALWIALPGMTLPDDAAIAVEASDTAQALAAALAGMGRTMLPTLLAKRALAAGTLKAVASPEKCRRAYWLVAPRPQWRQAKMRQLSGFLSDDTSD